MVKIYEKYLQKKLENNKKIYLFKSGIFYIALDEDAYFLNDNYNLKLTNYNQEIKKCGFPVKSLEKYKQIFNTQKLQFEIVKDNDPKKIIKALENIDINNITPVDALNKLKDIIQML